jgi:hypothetical protein
MVKDTACNLCATFSSERTSINKAKSKIHIYQLFLGKFKLKDETKDIRHFNILAEDMLHLN